MTIGSFLEKKKIREYITNNKMLKEGDGVVIGLSGGPDSECLFFVLLELKKEYNLTLKAIHINHMIRGEAADKDQAFVEKLCKDNAVDFESIKIDIPALIKKTGRSLEEEARLARYAEFERVANELEQKVEGQVRIAIAHNADDNAETVLFHMARGAGIDGVCGILPVRDRIIRPLLNVKKSEILDFLEENQLSYCIDGTNSDTEYTRNRIRHNIIPELVKVNDKALEHISDMTQRLQELQSFVELEANGLLCMAQEPDGSLRKRTLITAPAVLRAYALKIYLSKFMPDEKDVSAVHVEQIMSLLNSEGEKSVDLPHYKTFVISYDKVFVIDKGNADEEKKTGTFEFKEFSEFDHTAYPRNNYTKWFDCDKINGNIEIRTREEGDYLVINSSGGTKSIQDYFIDAKIPKYQRDSILLLCDGKHVMWVVGYRISEYYKVTEETGKVLEVRYMEEEIKNE